MQAENHILYGFFHFVQAELNILKRFFKMQKKRFDYVLFVFKESSKRAVNSEFILKNYKWNYKLFCIIHDRRWYFNRLISIPQSLLEQFTAIDQQGHTSDETRKLIWG
jgi:hypothetical protein